MSESSCQHKPLCSCHNVSEFIDNAKNKIERCIQKYMSLEETMTYLQDDHKISHRLTKQIWEQLQRENQDFFKNYHLRCEMARQTKMFNDLLAKQVALTLEHGHIDICQASPAIMTFLCQTPEGIRLMDKLANRSSYKTMASSSSLALPVTNGPTVNQLQIPYDKQNQFHQYPWHTSNDLAYNYPGASAIAPAATDQCTRNDFAYYHGAPTIAAVAATDQWPTFNDLAYIEAQTVAQAAPAPQDPSTLEFTGDTGHNSLSFEHKDIDLLEQLPMQSEKQFQDLNGQYQHQLRLQQNFSPEPQQYGGSNGLQYRGSNGQQYRGGNNGLQYGGSNGQQYGEGTNGLQSIDPQLYHNFDTNELVQMYTSVDQQQPQGVNLHHHHPEEHELGTSQLQGQPLNESPESEVFNNPGYGNTNKGSKPA